MSREFVVQDASDSDQAEEERERLLRQDSRAGRRQLRRATAVVIFGVFAAAIALTVLFSEDSTEAQNDAQSSDLVGLAGVAPINCKTWLSRSDACFATDMLSCRCREQHARATCKTCSEEEVRNAAALESHVSERDLMNFFPSIWGPAAAPKKARPDPTPEQIAKGRLASFLVVGDWGFDAGLHGNVPNNHCQKDIAQIMRQTSVDLGDVQFIINVGDSFYPHGVTSKDDPQWQAKWRDIYPDEVRKVPWFSVYGNHDYQSDPCACTNDTTQCAQVNGNISNLRYFYMPNTSYFHEYPEYDLEILGLDLNKYMEGWNPSATMEFDDCRWTSCPQACWDVNERRTQAAFKLFDERMKNSDTKSMIVFSHYPTDYFNIHEPTFLSKLRDGRRNMLYLGGHRHNLDNVSVTQIYPGQSWLVGGGGGWSCDGGEQGFLQVEIGLDYSLRATPKYYDKNLCCPPPPSTTPSPWKGEGCGWIGNDNCVNDDPSACSCRSLNPDGPCKGKDPCEAKAAKAAETAETAETAEAEVAKAEA